MIYVSKNQLRQVEYLIGQSVQGHHVLFDSELVRKIFKKRRPGRFDDSIDKDELKKIENHIEKMILQPTLLQKRSYLERLSRHEYEQVVRTYFNIVENNIYENREARH